MEPDADQAQPTRSAITDAGIEGNSDNNPRTRSSNPSNTAPAGGLEYEGGTCDANARATVLRNSQDLWIGVSRGLSFAS